MEYFWKQQDDIPQGMGYPLFGKEHILSTAITLIIVVLFICIFIKRNKKTQQRILKAIPLFLILLESFKDLFLVSVHRFGIWYLPLHVCSMGIFVFSLAEYLPWKKAKKVFGEIALILIMPGALAALIFPDWTVYYPVLNFINLYAYVWHGLLVLYPILLLIRKDVTPSVKHIHYIILFLCIVVPPIYAFDKHYGVNYFFVNWPERDTPLAWLASFMGNPGYLIGYTVMAVTVILLIYLILYCFTGRKKDTDNGI